MTAASGTATGNNSRTAMPVRRDPDTGLTDLERAFLEEYLIEPNGTRAYQRVRPAATYDTARNAAARLLSRGCIRRELAKMRANRERRTGVTADRVIREWACIAFADLGDVFDFSGANLSKGWVRLKPGKRIPPAARRAIAKIKRTPLPNGREAVDVQLHSKTDALDKLSRHLGLYKDLPALEIVLGLLPPALADAVRREVARGVPGGGSGCHSALGGAGGTAGGDGGPPGPDDGVPLGGDAAGPVAGAVPAAGQPAGGGPVLPAGGQVGDLGGEDLDALFDDP